MQVGTSLQSIWLSSCRATGCLPRGPTCKTAPLRASTTLRHGRPELGNSPEAFISAAQRVMLWFSTARYLQVSACRSSSASRLLTMAQQSSFGYHEVTQLARLASAPAESTRKDWAGASSASHSHITTYRDDASIAKVTVRAWLKAVQHSWGLNGHRAFNKCKQASSERQVLPDRTCCRCHSDKATRRLLQMRTSLRSWPHGSS